MSAELQYARKDRRDGVTGELKLGPVHIWGRGQTLCGRRIKGFFVGPTTSTLDGSICADCSKHATNGTEGSWKGGR